MKTSLPSLHAPLAPVLALLALGLAVRAGLLSAQAAEPVRRPNIVFIMCDQQSWDMMSCMGNRWVKTPALDSLAASGIRFDQAICTHPLCVPSRVSLQTGMLAGAHAHIRKNGESYKRPDPGAPKYDPLPMPQEIVATTLGKLFMAAGYETVYGGKTHLPEVIDPVPFSGKKDKHYTPFAGAADDSTSHFSDAARVNAKKKGWIYLTDDRTDALAAASAEYLNQPHEKPFFLFVSFIQPHDICSVRINDYAEKNDIEKKKKTSRDMVPPDRLASLITTAEAEGGVTPWDAIALFNAPEEQRGQFIERFCPPLPANFEPMKNEPEGVAISVSDEADGWGREWSRTNWTEANWRIYRWMYGRLTEHLDRQVGVVLEGLCKSGQLESTLVVFTSDHGDCNASHRLEQKALPFQNCMRVPLILSYPGVIPPARVNHHLVSNGLDIYPTLCDFAGITVPPGRLGLSLRGLAEGKTPETWRELVPVEFQYGWAIRTPKYTYALFNCGANPEMLVDLEQDPNETVNLASDPTHAATLKQYRELMRSWAVKCGDAPLLKKMEQGVK